MTKRLLSITTVIPTGSGVAWWPCEINVSDDVPDDDDVFVDHVMASLLRDGMIRVTKLDLEKLGGRQRRVRKRRAAVITRNIIGSIAPLHVDIVEG